MPTEDILGLPVTSDTVSDCAAIVLSWIHAPTHIRTVACVNPHSIVTMRRDPEFAEAMRGTDLLIPDGAGVVLASRLLRGSIRARITGSDLFATMNADMNREKDFSCFFLGSAVETLDMICRHMAQDYPHIRIAGTFSPPFKQEFSPEDEDAMIDSINNARPHLLWVGLTQPKQEKLVHAIKNRLAAKVAISVGAVFDFYSGRVKRPSSFFQHTGLEWFPRFLREPRRLWRRNLDAPLFIFHVLRERLRRNKSSIC